MCGLYLVAHAEHSRYDFVNPLAFVIGWHCSMIHYCLMHTLHLGLLHHVNGGCLLCLMDLEFFGALSVFICPHDVAVWKKKLVYGSEPKTSWHRWLFPSMTAKRPRTKKLHAFQPADHGDHPLPGVAGS